MPSATDARAQAVAFTQLTGLLSLGMMAFANLLSARPTWLEPALDGLDKMYRLHKWLGIGGLAVAILHWQTGTGTRPSAAEAASAAGSWWQAMQGPAHYLATPVLLLLIVLVAVALIRAIPYRIFAKLHLLTVPVFAYFAFHSVILMKADYWMKPAGWLIMFLGAAGTVSGIIGLINYFGGRRVSRAAVISSHYFPELRVLETILQLDGRWPGHQPGQFAFVSTNAFEGAHPFTIATHWNPAERQIGFIAKELGDDTSKLRQNFREGAVAKIQGPYGRFTFDDEKPRQIWISGGIGVTPFIAKMRELAGHRSGKKIDLFHSTIDFSEEALAKLQSDAASAGVTLHLMIDSRDGLLDFSRLAGKVADWRAASVWFCGPTAFGAAMRRDFLANGLPASDFHQELFEMR